MHSCAHHVPGREGSCNQTKEREGTIVLERGKKHCQQRHKTPHDGPCPESACTVRQAMTCDCSVFFVLSLSLLHNLQCKGCKKPCHPGKQQAPMHAYAHGSQSANEVWPCAYIIQIVKVATQQGGSMWCKITKLPFVEAIIQVVGIAGTGNDLHHCQAQQRHHVEEEGCSLSPRTHQTPNDLMILNDVIPVQHKSIAAVHVCLWQLCSCCKSSLQQKQLTCCACALPNAACSCMIMSR